MEVSCHVLDRRPRNRWINQFEKIRLPTLIWAVPPPMYQCVVCSKIIGESIHIRLHTLGFQAKMCTYSVTIMQEEYQFGWQQSLPMSLELLPPSSRSTKFSFSMMTANNATRRLRSAPFCAPPQTHCQNIGKNRSQKVTRKTLVSVVGFIIGFASAAAGSKCYWKK